MRRLSILIIPLLLGTTGCDPCSGINARLAPPLLHEIVEDGTHVLLQASTIGLGSRLSDSFPEGDARWENGMVSWDTLAITLNEAGSNAAVGIRLHTGDAVLGGTLRFPIALATKHREGGFTIGATPSGPSSLSLSEGAPPAGLQARLDSQRASWLEASPLLEFSGWYRPGKFLPISASQPTLDGAVLRVEIATALPAAPIDAGERATRPGMADDFTMAISSSLLSQLARGGWRPVLAGPSTSEAWAPPSGWSLAALAPGAGKRSLDIPVVARRTESCSYLELTVQVGPAVVDGGFGWKPDARHSVLGKRGEASEDETASLVASSLLGLSAPLAQLPVRGPDKYPAVLRIARSQNNTLLLDGLLGPIKVNRKAPPLRGLPPGTPTSP